MTSDRIAKRTPNTTERTIGFASTNAGIAALGLLRPSGAPGVRGSRGTHTNALPTWQWQRRCDRAR
jgi:hypothetical protein